VASVGPRLVPASEAGASLAYSIPAVGATGMAPAGAAAAVATTSAACTSQPPAPLFGPVAARSPLRGSAPPRSEMLGMGGGASEPLHQPSNTAPGHVGGPGLRSSLPALC